MSRKYKKIKAISSKSDLVGDLKHLPLHQWATAGIAIIGIMISAGNALFGERDIAIVSLLSTMAISALINNLDRAVFQKRAAQDLGDILSQHDGLKHIGGIPSAVDWFVRHANNIVAVRKTVQHPPAHETDPFDEASAKFGEAMRRCLDRGCSWNELALFPHKETVERTVQTFTPQNLRHYKARYLEADVPIPQIMIVRFNDKRKAALIGFTFNGGDPLDDVFIAEDGPAVEYFDRYFSALLEKGKPIQMPAGSGIPSPPRTRLFRRSRQDPK